jgi:hypothetical protein
VTAGPLSWVVGFIADPRWGIPFLLMVEATFLWAAWNPRPPAPLGLRRTSWARPVADPVSRMFYALGDERYSVLVRWSRERIEELYEARHGQRLPSFTLDLFGSSEGPENRFEIRRLTRDLASFEWEAREREAGAHIRWAFWRTRRRDDAVYRSRVERLLERAQHAIIPLEGVAA